MYFNLFEKDKYPLLIHGLFWLVALVNIWALSQENVLIDLITKPLLIPLLSLYYIAYKKKSSVYFLIQFISWMGSLCFIGEMPETTIVGIIFFLGSTSSLSPRHYTILRNTFLQSIVSTKKGHFIIDISHVFYHDNAPFRAKSKRVV